MAERTSLLSTRAYPILRCLHCRKHKFRLIEIVYDQTQVSFGNKKAETRVFRS